MKLRIVDIVEKNYTDPMLNVSHIANMLEKNVDYISRVFRRTTHIGLLEYIHHTRVKASKALLADRREYTITEIGQMVGYISIDSYIRSFKRIEGITPGKYREAGLA